MNVLDRFNEIYAGIIKKANEFRHTDFSGKLEELQKLSEDPSLDKIDQAVLKTKLEMLSPILVLYKQCTTYRYQLKEVMIYTHEGNRDEYDIETIKAVDSPLKDKKIIFLGSSVTYGAASMAQSFADMLVKKHGIKMIKEAVSGTVLVEEDNEHGRSYVSRLRDIDKDFKADLFVCQLSTNDATNKKPLGAVSASKNMADFDTRTIIGAIEYIIAYAAQNWNCPVMFYTGTKYDDALYAQMVAALYDIQKKWDIEILDMWNDEQMCAVDPADYKLYMNDAIHPTKAGYKIWWLPQFEKALLKHFGE